MEGMQIDRLGKDIIKYLKSTCHPTMPLLEILFDSVESLANLITTMNTASFNNPGLPLRVKDIIDSC